MTGSLRELLDKATPGPWRRPAISDHHIYANGRWPSASYGHFREAADAALVVEAVNCLPALLDIADSLRETVAELRRVAASNGTPAPGRCERIAGKADAALAGLTRKEIK